MTLQQPRGDEQLMDNTGKRLYTLADIVDAIATTAVTCFAVYFSRPYLMMAYAWAMSKLGSLWINNELKRITGVTQ
jgi:hypothetical protein